MAGLFTHVWIANLVLQKLSLKSFISKPENIDDYFFGAVAPDIRYITGSARDITHKPKGENSIFEAMKVSSLSAPFMAGYETHLIVDQTWSNENGLMKESIYKHYGVDVNGLVQKFSLYLAVDDYFQGETDWLFQVSAVGNILRANDLSVLSWLGFGQNEILMYKSGVALYLREPGIDTFNLLNVPQARLNESAVKEVADLLPGLTSFLKEFKKISVENCVESMEKYL